MLDALKFNYPENGQLSFEVDGMWLWCLHDVLAKLKLDHIKDLR